MSDEARSSDNSFNAFQQPIVGQTRLHATPNQRAPVLGELAEF